MFSAEKEGFLNTPQYQQIRATARLYPCFEEIALETACSSMPLLLHLEFIYCEDRDKY